MAGRTCQTCKHYEPSGMWRRGWCRNPRLYGPQHSHLVDEDSLDCSRGLGCAWEPIDPHHRDGEAESRVRQPLLLFGPQTSLALAGGASFASSSLGGGGTGGDRPPGGPFRPARTPAGQERTVSFQPEERYWTDYLRIALPVVGLLLLIGLLWFWLSGIVGNGGDQPVSTTVAMLTPINEPATPTSTPAPTAAPVVVTPGTPAPTAAPTEAPNVTVAPPTAPPERTPAAATTEAASGANPCAGFPTYPSGTIIETTDTVNLRDNPTTSANIRQTLPPGTKLQVAGEFSEGGEGQCDWWPVTVVDSGQTGYVSEQFVRASS